VLFEQPFTWQLKRKFRLQRKIDINTKIQTIEKESKNIMWVWEKKLSQIICRNIISLINKDKVGFF